MKTSANDSPKMPDFLGRQMAANIPKTCQKFPYYSVGKWLKTEDENGCKYPDDSPKMPNFVNRRMAANISKTRQKCPSKNEKMKIDENDFKYLKNAPKKPVGK